MVLEGAELACLGCGQLFESGQLVLEDADLFAEFCVCVG